jgi:hypothetical protein
MIEIRTNLTVTTEGTAKTVVMEMDGDSALTFATILMNYDTRDVSMEWLVVMAKTTRLLIDAGNRCR